MKKSRLIESKSTYIKAMCGASGLSTSPLYAQPSSGLALGVNYGSSPRIWYGFLFEKDRRCIGGANTHVTPSFTNPIQLTIINVGAFSFFVSGTLYQPYSITKKPPDWLGPTKLLNNYHIIPKWKPYSSSCEHFLDYGLLLSTRLEWNTQKITSGNPQMLP
jgi:hypothetical protein